jgi:hypothetical protein
VYSLRGDWQKAARRWSGQTDATLNGVSVRVQYPTIRELRRTLSPWFGLRRVQAVGLGVPPSYMEGWAGRHPRIFRALMKLDSIVSGWPLFRACGDHVLFTFQRDGQ